MRTLLETNKILIAANDYPVLGVMMGPGCMMIAGLCYDKVKGKSSHLYYQKLEKTLGATYEALGRKIIKAENLKV
jgi:hypothetical protein